MKKRIAMRDALADPKLLGHALSGESWSAWRTLLIAAVGEKLTPTERKAFKRFTGRAREPGSMVETFLAVAGRRSGKSRAMAVLIVYLAILVDWSDDLSLGERGIAMFLAPSERQAATTFRYAAAIIDAAPLLRARVTGRTADVIELDRGVDLEIAAASWRRSRGATAVAIVLDECSFLHTGDESTNSDTELMIALRPSLATTNGPMLITSSPGAMEGIVFRLFKRHFGPDGDTRTLVVQSDSRGLNPRLSKRVIDRAFEDDPVAAESEFGGSFRQAMAAYLDRAIVEKAIERGASTRMVRPGTQYVAFVDVAGGSGTDSFTCAIGHKWVSDNSGREICVLDALLEVRPPFDPDVVTASVATLLRTWNVSHVIGDAYAASWPITAFARHGIGYSHATLSASEIYLHCVPLFTAGRVLLLDQPRLVDQLCALRRKVGQGGRESVDHPRGAHDDLANAVAGVLWRLSPPRPATTITAPLVGIAAQHFLGDIDTADAPMTNPATDTSHWGSGGMTASLRHLGIDEAAMNRGPRPRYVSAWMGGPIYAAPSEET
jgi:hypothetical protein